MSNTKPPAATLPDSDWSKRSKAISFRKLMYIEPHPTKPNCFHSTSAAYPPTESTRTYGGHVFAQSAWAAAHTVSYGLHVHSMTGYFLLLGDTEHVFEYRVRRIRDGGVYCLRQVEAYQNSPAASDGKSPVFVALVSFKRDERRKHEAGAKDRRRTFEHQELPSDWLQREYGTILAKKKSFEEWPVCQGMDGMWPENAMSIEDWKRRGDAFPGLDMRKVDMSGYNSEPVIDAMADEGNAARKWRLLTLYKIVVDDEAVTEGESGSQDRRRQPKRASEDIINLHACAHLYASDRNSLFLCQRALGYGKVKSLAGSLSHTVNFHTHASELLMINPENSQAKEFAQEAWTSASGGDRVSHNSRIWDLTSQKIIASTVQDGMLRAMAEQSRNVIDGDLILRREAKL